MPGTHPPPADVPANGSAAPQVRLLVEEVGRLLATSTPPEEFYAAFLRRVLAATEARAGAVWGRGSWGDFQVQYQADLDAIGLDKVPQARACLAEALRLAAERRQPLCIPPHRGPGPASGNGTPANLTGHALFLAPILVDEDVDGFVEVWRPGGTDARTGRGLASLLGEVTGFVAAYRHKTRWQQLRQQQQLWEQLRAYAARVHGGLDPKEVAYLAANEGRRLLGCDQLSVAVRHGRKALVEAISGAPFIEPRGPLQRAMQRLCTAVLAWGETLVYAGVGDPALPPDVLQALDQYLAQGKSRTLIALPLRHGRQGEDEKPCAVLLAECVNPTVGAEPLQARMESLAPETAAALANALQHQRLPLRWLSAPLARLQDWLRPRGLVKLGLGAGAALALVGALTFVHTPLRTEAVGELVPKERQVVYSTLNGKVVELKAQHGEAVARGQELLLMEDPDLQLQVEQLAIKVSAAEQRLATLGQQLGRATTNDERNSLTREMVNQEYEMRKAAAERDIILEGARNPRRSPVLSPLAGKVVTFDARDQLVGKTVKPGDPLLRVARVQGPWEVELYIPEGHVAAVREGLAGSPEGLDVQLLLASHPHRTYRGRLTQDGLGGETTVRNNAVVLPARARITDRDLLTQLDGMPVGVEVRAKVDCGRRPVGYVWFAGLWDFLYEHVLF
jgi:multidrug efflux pump subunit AcrA (membrane-fusion protein)